MCQVVYHLTRLDGTKVFKLLCGYSVSTANYHEQNNIPYEKVFVISSEKLMTPFFDLQFFDALRIVQENEFHI